MSDLHVLPTEPLLDVATDGISQWKSTPLVKHWLADIAGEGDPDSRAVMLYSALRKQFGQTHFSAMVKGLLGAAARNEQQGAQALGAFLAVRASGELLVQRVARFANTRRVLERLHARPAAQLRPAEKAWQRRLSGALDHTGTEASRELYSDPSRLAARFAEVFAGLIARVEDVGRLEKGEVDVLDELSRVELDALEIRAGDLAGTIDPFSPRHVTQVMPVLAEIDGDLRVLRQFLVRMQESRSGALFSEHVPVFSEVLDASDEHRIREFFKGDAGLQIGWRLIRGLDRNPLPPRTLAWFMLRVLEVGAALTRAELRTARMDIVAAALCVLDHHSDGVLTIPASEAVRQVVRTTEVEGVELSDVGLEIVLDPLGARRLSLPWGLPLAEAVAGEAVEPEEEAEQTVKEIVIANLNNISVLLGLLKNQKVTSTPGIVAMVAERSRNMRVLDTICQTRALYTGHANKDVPRAILKSQMNIPIKQLRKFVGVRFVSKIELKRLERDRSAIRREVADEIEIYLKSLV